MSLLFYGCYGEVPMMDLVGIGIEVIGVISEGFDGKSFELVRTWREDQGALNPYIDRRQRIKVVVSTPVMYRCDARKALRAGVTVDVAGGVGGTLGGNYFLGASYVNINVLTDAEIKALKDADKF
jgi:hypothetical protein